MILRDRPGEAVTLQPARSRVSSLARSRPSRHKTTRNSNPAKSRMTSLARNETIVRAKTGPTGTTTATANAVDVAVVDAEAATADVMARHAKVTAVKVRDAKAKAAKPRVAAKVLTAAGTIIETVIHAVDAVADEAIGLRHLQYLTC